MKNQIEILIEKYKAENKDILKRRPDLEFNIDFSPEGVIFLQNQGFIQKLSLCGVNARCANCKYWQAKPNTEYSIDMGNCTFLSGKHIKDGQEIGGKKYTLDEYPDPAQTGIESLPICHHDGSGFSYETKKWFSCIHFHSR